jgi:hypothetical protein
MLQKGGRECSSTFPAECFREYYYDQHINVCEGREIQYCRNTREDGPRNGSLTGCSR